MNKSNECVKKKSVIGSVLIAIAVLCACGLHTSEGQMCELCPRSDKGYDCSGKDKTGFICEVWGDCLENVSFMDLSNNAITDLSNTGCLNDITVFNVSHNKLTKLNAFQSAEEGDISFNKLEGDLQLDIFNMIYLKKLIATNNKLTKVNCFGAKELKVLDVTGNRIESIQNCASLQELRASSNRLEGSSLKELENLQYLDISNNSLSEISNLPSNLKTLVLSQNQLKNKKFEHFKNLRFLEVLDLSWTSLEVIPPLQLGPSIREINLSNNNIHDIDILTLENLIKDDNNSSTNAIIDLRNNSLSKNGKGMRKIVYNSEFNINSSECACVNATRNSVSLLFCVLDAEEERPCWWEVELLTTTTEAATTKPSPAPQNDQANTTEDHHKQDMIGPEEKNETQPLNSSEPLSHAAYFLESFGAAKLSFLGFLLLTLIALIVINCIVGDPVVDDYWWEEKQPSDQPVT